jgi:hypothetical protein
LARNEGGLFAAATPCVGGSWSQQWRYEGWAGGAPGRIVRDADGSCLFASGCGVNTGGVNNVAVVSCDSAAAEACPAGLLWTWSGAAPAAGGITNIAAGPSQCLEVWQVLNKWQAAGPVVRLVNCSWPSPEPGNLFWDMNTVNQTIQVHAGTGDGYHPDTPGLLCLDSTGVVPPGAAEIWAGPLADEGNLQRWVVLLFYRTDGLSASNSSTGSIGIPDSISITASWPLIGWGMESLTSDALVGARDVLNQTTLATVFSGGIGASLAPDQVAVFILSYPRDQRSFPVAVMIIIGVVVICCCVIACAQPTCRRHYYSRRRAGDIDQVRFRGDGVDSPNSPDPWCCNSPLRTRSRSSLSSGSPLSPQQEGRGGGGASTRVNIGISFASHPQLASLGARLGTTPQMDASLAPLASTSHPTTMSSSYPTHRARTKDADISAPLVTLPPPSPPCPVASSPPPYIFDIPATTQPRTKNPAKYNVLPEGDPTSDL